MIIIFQVSEQNKPIKEGIRIYALACEGGYVFEISPHLGNGNTIASHVLYILDALKAEGHILAADNLFTSPNLFDTLRDDLKVNAMGTLRGNRGGPLNKDEAAKTVKEKGDSSVTTPIVVLFGLLGRIAELLFSSPTLVTNRQPALSNRELNTTKEW